MPPCSNDYAFPASSRPCLPRNQEAINNKLAYSEFLALLVQDEVARREHEKFNLRLRRAGFRGEKTLEGFAFNPAINQALVKDLATCAFIKEKVAVLIAGPCGTGKSHIAQALGHLAVRAGNDTLFTTQTKLLGQLHAARATGTFEHRFHHVVRTPLLIIDDFGHKPMAPPPSTASGTAPIASSSTAIATAPQNPDHTHQKNTLERRLKNTNYIPRPKPQNRHFQVVSLCRSWVA